MKARLLGLAVLMAMAGAVVWAHYARHRLPPSSPGAQLNVPLPDLTLPDESGNAVRLAAPGRPTLLVWFRGSWCPYCRRQLAELAAEAGRYPEVRLLAVSADPPEPLRKLKRELGLPFPLLSDPDRRLVNHCELAHCVAVADPRGIVRWEVSSGNWEKDLQAGALFHAAASQK